MQVTITSQAVSDIMDAGRSMFTGGLPLYALVVSIPFSFYIARKVKSIMPKEGPRK